MLGIAVIIVGLVVVGCLVVAFCCSFGCCVFLGVWLFVQLAGLVLLNSVGYVILLLVVYGGLFSVELVV